MVFAFNCVSVALIIVELYRFNYNKLGLFIHFGKELDGYFKKFSDAREKGEDLLIFTHILLLLGCAVPPTIQFIILEGGIPNLEFIIFGISGLIILGIGDSAAAVFGKEYGTTRWSDYSKKT